MIEYCDRCKYDIDSQTIPVVNGVCWLCQLPADRQEIKKIFKTSPSIVEKNYAQFIEAYEKRNNIVFVNAEAKQLEYEWQKMAQTEDENFWKISTGDDEEKPKTRDGRRRAIGRREGEDVADPEQE